MYFTLGLRRIAGTIVHSGGATDRMAGALQKMVEFRPQPQRVTCDRTGREATCYSSGLTASTGQQLAPLAWTSNLSQGFPGSRGPPPLHESGASLPALWVRPVCRTGAGLPATQPLGSSHCTAAVQCQDKQAEPTKRPRLAPTDQAMASAPRPRRAIQPLTMTELTRGFLAHEDELQTILHQLSMVHKLPADGPLAVAVLEAVQGWLQVHRPGTASRQLSMRSRPARTLLPLTVER